MLIRRVVQLCPAQPGWFAVYRLDGSASFQAIAFWALCEASGENIMVPITTDNFLAPPGEIEGTEAFHETFLGVMAPGEDRKEWEREAKERSKPKGRAPAQK